MFKVRENGDGSTSIFCSNTGKLICTIRNQPRNMGLGYRPTNVESSPRSRSCYYNIGTEESQNLQDRSIDANPVINSRIENVEEEEEESVIPVYDEPDEDIPECLTSDEFARCLNLVSTEKLKNQSVDELNSTFPLRLISRTKALPNDSKVPEELPITSSVGLKILETNKTKNFCDDQSNELRIKNYENFCRFQINSSYVFNHPNLRCRDKKEYPVCFSSKNSKCATAHTYAFNRTQRLENLITIKTGLNTQSRKLLRSCNKKLTVSIKRLPDEEVKYWMQKRARLGPITAELIRGEDSSFMGSDSESTVIEQNNSTYVDIDLCSDESSEPNNYDDDPPYRCKVRKESNFQGVLSSNLSPLRNRNGQSPTQLMNHFQNHKKCSVLLKNVLHSLWECQSDYYIAGTNIKVPFLQDYLNSLNPKKRSTFIIPETDLITAPQFTSQHDHAYHRPFSTIHNNKKSLLSNSNCLNHKNSKTKNNLKNNLKRNGPVKNKSLKLNSVKNSNSLKNINKRIIPIIDLTLSPPNSPRKARGNCSFCSFRCYGCGYNVKTHNEVTANILASQHLLAFHCVSDPKSHLNLNNSSSGIILEAFPGYKKDSVG